MLSFFTRIILLNFAAANYSWIMMSDCQEMRWPVGNPERYWKEGPVDGYWHVYSDGKRADIPFLTDEDKIFARNSVAICAYQSGVTVLVVTVNDTHLHVFIGLCTGREGFTVPGSSA